jgi:hypothetical protein
VQEASSVSRSESLGSLALWFGILGAPTAWGIQILVGYNIDEIVCSPGSQSGELAGVGTETWIVVLHIVLTVMAVAALLVSFACWRRTGVGDSSPAQRARWMALAGLMVSAFFLLIILSGFAPTAFLKSCEQTP